MNPYGFNIKKLWKNILMATFHKFIRFFVHIKKAYHHRREIFH